MNSFKGKLGNASKKNIESVIMIIAGGGGGLTGVSRIKGEYPERYGRAVFFSLI